MYGTSELNLVIPCVGEGNIPWHKVGLNFVSVYKELADKEVTTVLGNHGAAIGFLYTIHESTKMCKLLGTAFLLAPQVAVSAMHVVQAVNESEQLFFSVVPKKSISGDDIEFYHNETGSKVISIHSEAVYRLSPQFPDSLLDPTTLSDIRIDDSENRIDFCMFQLQKPFTNIPFFIPHYEIDFAHCHVAVLGIPSVVTEDYVRKHKLPLSANTYNQHVKVALNVGSCYCVSIGSVRDERGKFNDEDVVRSTDRCVAHDSYTHPGNSGSPVFPLSHPRRLLGIHIGSGVSPMLNIMVPTLNPVFAYCYVKYVMPVIADKLLADEKEALACYLKVVFDKIRPLFTPDDWSPIEQFVIANNVQLPVVTTEPPSVLMPADNTGGHARKRRAVALTVPELTLEQEAAMVAHLQRVDNQERGAQQPAQKN